MHLGWRLEAGALLTVKEKKVIKSKNKSQVKSSHEVIKKSSQKDEAYLEVLFSLSVNSGVTS